MSICLSGIIVLYSKVDTFFSNQSSAVSPPPAAYLITGTQDYSCVFLPGEALLHDHVRNDVWELRVS